MTTESTLGNKDGATTTRLSCLRWLCGSLPASRRVTRRRVDIPSTRSRWLVESIGMLACLAVGCGGPSAGAADHAHSVSLSSWTTRVDTIAGDNTRVMRPAEFWDSVLIVPDVGERRLWRVSLESGDRQPFGSLGRGPGEYPRASWALKVHVASVAIVQGASFAPFPIVSVSSGRGRTLRFESNPPVAANVVAAMAQSTHLYYSDTLGHLYGSPALSTSADVSRETLQNSELISAAHVQYFFRVGGPC